MFYNKSEVDTVEPTGEVGLPDNLIVRCVKKPNYIGRLLKKEVQSYGTYLYGKGNRFPGFYWRGITFTSRVPTKSEQKRWTEQLQSMELPNGSVGNKQTTKT